MGVSAVQELMAGNNNVMIGERNNQLLTVPLSIAVQHNEKVSENLVSAQENILALTAQY
jgi:6-phosphofructokinase 1